MKRPIGTSPVGRTFAMFVSFSAIAAVVVSFSSDRSVDADHSLEALVAKAHLLQATLRMDNSRNEPLLFAQFDPAAASDLVRHEVRTIAEESIATSRRWIDSSHLDSPAERRVALLRLRRNEFQIDSRISSRDIAQVVEAFHDHRFLDPRVISMEYLDDDTISITTGAVRGLLNGGGCYYVARRESGAWIVRRNGSWVS